MDGLQMYQASLQIDIRYRPVQTIDRKGDIEATKMIKINEA